jgi:predicted alpha/beta hydrolase family esterase
VERRVGVEMNNSKQQVIVIHGSDSFKTYEEFINSLKTWEVTPESFRQRHDWKTTLRKKLGSDFDVYNPRMPNKGNAKYIEWKIWFERMFPFMEDNVILVGHSVGAMFLVKYLSKNIFPRKIEALHLVAPPHNQTADCEDFKLPDSLAGVEKQVDNIFLYQSKDDPIVPFSELAVFEKQLPGAKSQIFEDRGHFNQDEFPELITNLND